MSEQWEACPRCATREHRDEVAALLRKVAVELLERAAVHDESKLETPEVEMFDAATSKLRGLEYGSEEYRQALADLGPALKHHYTWNRHHPEWHATSWRGMSLLDLIEALCDWAAASKRHATGSVRQSLDINRTRFEISDDVMTILTTTARELGLLKA